MNSLESLLRKILAQINIVIMLGLLLIVCWQVISRYLLNAPSTVSEEVARILLMWLGMLGAAYTASEKGHMAIDLLSQKISPANQLNLNRFISLLCALFTLVLTIGGVNVMNNAFILGQTTPVLGLPMGLIYSALPIGSLFMCYFFYRFFISEQ